MTEASDDARIRALNSSMIQTIRNYGLSDEKVLSAIEKVHRHRFMPTGFDIDEIYGDHALPIGSDQTISQPFTVAFMLELLELSEGLDVLEIGTGSGWNAALIKEIVGKKGHVTTIEYVAGLTGSAKENLIKAGYEVNIVTGDGSLGYKKNAPYDRIIATCASPDILDAWKEQLKNDGIIVAPIGRYVQEMIKFRKTKGEAISGKDGSSYSSHGSFSFVPLLGKSGFSE